MNVHRPSERKADDTHHTATSTIPLTKARRTRTQRCQHILEVMLLSLLDSGYCHTWKDRPPSNTPHIAT